MSNRTNILPGAMAAMLTLAAAAQAQWKIPSPRTLDAPGAAEAPASDPRSYPDEAGFEKRSKLIIEGLVPTDLQAWRKGWFAITEDQFASADPTNSRINKMEITTQVLLENGQTVVIGGIYEQEKLNTVDKVPLFADLPLLGWLFNKKTTLDNKTELLIFLTPRILAEALSLK